MVPLIGRHEEASAVARIVVAVGAPVVTLDASAAVRARSGGQLVNLRVALAREIQRRRDRNEFGLIDRTNARSVPGKELHLQTRVRRDEAYWDETRARHWALSRTIFQDGLFSRRRAD